MARRRGPGRTSVRRDPPRRRRDRRADPAHNWRHLPPADLGGRVIRLNFVGKILPRRLRDEILAFGREAVPCLVDQLRWGRAWGRIHAAWLLGALRPPSAVRPMLAVLAETSWGDFVHDAVLRSLPRIGEPVLEPALAALADTHDEDVLIAIGSVLASSGLRDERIFDVLVENLRLDPSVGAINFMEYGDERALEHLARAFDGHVIVDDGEYLANDALVTLHEAIEELGGSLTPAQKKKLDGLDHARWERQVAAARKARARAEQGRKRKADRNANRAGSRETRKKRDGGGSRRGSS
ncbi:hypothetical protein HY251_04175 [bacterium]|nr:hypothetical protein [bacterium]